MSFRRTHVYLMCVALVLAASAVAVTACGGSDAASQGSASPTASTGPVAIAPGGQSSPASPAVAPSPGSEASPGATSPSVAPSASPGTPTKGTPSSTPFPTKTITPKPTPKPKNTASQVPAATVRPTPSAPATPAPGATTLAGADLAAVRASTTGYWTAYNAYDADKALSYLEDGYRKAVEKTVRSEIGKLKTFGVKLGVSEKGAPLSSSPDRAVIFLNMTTPTGARIVSMAFARVGGAWKITAVTEVK